jgi:nicotinamide riboside transporter PnuC
MDLTLKAIADVATNLETISWLATFVALYGTYLNSQQDRNGFWWWIVSNVSFCVINLSYSMYAQSLLFAVFTALAIRGLIKWDKKVK